MLSATQINSAWPSLSDTVSTSQRAVMPCGGWRQVWFVCGWQVNLCDPLVIHVPYLSTLEM